jgi:hypothetical protein
MQVEKGIHVIPAGDTSKIICIEQNLMKAIA